MLAEARWPTLADALDHVKAHRPCAQPNHGFLQQLLSIDTREWRAWLRGSSGEEATPAGGDAEGGANGAKPSREGAH